MTDLDQIRAYALAHLDVVDNPGSWLIVRVRVGQASEQHILVEPVQVLGRPWLSLWGSVCKSDRIDFRRALVHNGTVAVGAVAIQDDWYVVKHAVAMDRLVGDDLVRLVELLAHEAVRLRANEVLPEHPEEALRFYEE